jgi:hypothetical protein
MTQLEPLPGVPGWEMWSVASYIDQRTTWSGRPVGSPHALVHADSVPRLATLAVEWLDKPQSEIDRTVAELRRKLDATPESHVQERVHLAACIDTEYVARRAHARLI